MTLRLPAFFGLPAGAARRSGSGLLALLLAGPALESGGAPPVIDYQARSQSVVVYQSAAFSVTANGTAPLRYQWHKDGAIIEGATNEQLVIARAEFSDAGVYNVAVSNEEGLVTGSDAEMTVKAPRGGDVDYTFASNSGINGAVLSVTSDGEGCVVIAGGFTTVHRGVRNGIARLKGDGGTDHSFLNVPSTGVISAIALQSDGRLVVGGYFTMGNGASRTNIARLNRNGSVDTSFMNRLAGADSSVNAVAVQADGKVLIAGDFTAISGAGCERIARLDLDGTLDSTFLNGLAWADNSITSLAVQRDGKVLIGGHFTTVNGEGRSRVARLDVDGSLDSTFQDALAGANNTVHAMAIQNDGKALIGGEFTEMNGERRDYVARLNMDGTLDRSFLEGLDGADDAVRTVAIQSDGKVLIGGYFASVNGESRRAIARLNADGTLDPSFQAGLPGANHYVRSVVVERTGKVLIGGLFTQVNGQSRQFVARLNDDGTLDDEFRHEAAGADNTVESLAVQSDERIVIGGSFGNVAGAERNNIARLKADGSLDGSFGHGMAGANGVVIAVGTLRDNRAVIGGSFTAVNGGQRSFLARLNADGSLDEEYLLGLTGPSDAVFALAVQGDEKVIIGGTFTEVNNVNRSSIARLNRDGTLDRGFLEGLRGVNGFVEAIALQGDGKVVVGGSFSRVNNAIRHSIARLEPNGRLDAGFQEGMGGTDQVVGAMALQRDGKILIGGLFTRVNGVDRRSIARLNPDGTLDASFQNGLGGANGSVEAIALQRDGRVLIGGRFTSVNGMSRRGIGRLNPDGTLDSSFQSGFAGVENVVEAVAVLRDGNVVIGGSFALLNEQPTAWIARLWRNQPSIERLCKTDSDRVTLTLRLPPGVTNRVQYKSSLREKPWIDLPGDVCTREPSGLMDKVDATWGAGQQRFYRVVALP